MGTATPTPRAGRRLVESPSTGGFSASPTPTGRVCGVDIAAVTTDTAAQIIVAAAAARRSLQVHLCNAYTLSLVDRDPELRDALEESHLNLPDGSPIAWLLRRAGAHGPVRGPELVPKILRMGASAGLRHYFWGGAEGIAERAAARLQEIEPSVIIAGCEMPLYRDLDDAEVQALAQRVEGADANILWVGLGTPRQDYFVPRISRFLSIPVVPVGAAFDFLAGSITEAPARLHGSGFEWLHRLTREPRRLWRRYLFGNPRFIASAVKHQMNRSRVDDAGDGRRPHDPR